MSLRDLITFGLGPEVIVAGAADWTDDEKKQIRQALGITGTTAATSGTGTLEAAFAALASESDVASAVWDEARAGHVVDGTFGTGVLLAATQGAVTLGQVKIAANVAAQGALEVENAHATGFGVHAKGTVEAVYNEGGAIGMLNKGSTTGIYNQGTTTGAINYGGTQGLWNIGESIGMKNEGPTPTSPALALEATLTAIKGAGWTTETLAAIHAAIAALPGSGATSKVYTVTVGGVPLAGVVCRMTSDAGGTVFVDEATTNALGQATFWHNLPASTTVYIWRTLAGYAFTDPDTEVTT